MVIRLHCVGGRGRNLVEPFDESHPFLAQVCSPSDELQRKVG